MGFMVFFAVMIARVLILGQMSKTQASQNKINEIDPNILQRLLLVNGAREKIVKLVDQHLETLARRRFALVRVDHYGVVHGSDWNREVQHFVDEVVRPRLSTEEAEAVAPQMKAIFQELIEDRVPVGVTEI